MRTLVLVSLLAVACGDRPDAVDRGPDTTVAVDSLPILHPPAPADTIMARDTAAVG